MSALVWRLWPQSKIFSDNALDSIAQAYKDSLQDGYFLPHRNIERDIAESKYALDVDQWLDREEYNRYLDEARKGIPEPEPEDLEPEAFKHG